MIQRTTFIAAFIFMAGAFSGAIVTAVLPGFVGGEKGMMRQGTAAPPPEVDRLYRDGLLMMAKAAVARSLNDPYSAKFENLTVLKTKSGTIVCGTINAKNRFGAYVGRVPFYYSQLIDRALLGPSGSDYDDMMGRKEIADRCSGEEGQNRPALIP